MELSDCPMLFQLCLLERGQRTGGRNKSRETNRFPDYFISLGKTYQVSSEFGCLKLATSSPKYEVLASVFLSSLISFFCNLKFFFIEVKFM